MAVPGLATLNEAMIELTDKGAEKVREFLAAQAAVADTAGLRVGVRGGGCSGFQYALAFDTERDGDQVFEDHGLRLLVDGPSLPYVRGAVVDYVEGLQGAGFKVDNPNVIAACGCGSSFRVAEEEEARPGAGDGLDARAQLALVLGGVLDPRELGGPLHHRPPPQGGGP